MKTALGFTTDTQVETLAAKTDPAADMTTIISLPIYAFLLGNFLFFKVLKRYFSYLCTPKINAELRIIKNS